MAPTEGRVARPERRRGCRRGTPDFSKEATNTICTASPAATASRKLYRNRLAQFSSTTEINVSGITRSNIYMAYDLKQLIH